MSSYLRQPFKFKLSPTRWGGRKLSIRIIRLKTNIVLFGKPDWAPRWDARIKRIRGGIKWRISIFYHHTEGQIQYIYWDKGNDSQHGMRSRYKCPKCNYRASRKDFWDRGIYDRP